MRLIKKLWRYSKIRFYIKNALWNYLFWLMCRKKYNEVSFYVRSRRNYDIKYFKKKRFEGYIYKGKTYLDNPGVQNIEKDVWIELHKKGLV